jgi:hypothetical protein
MHHGHRRTRWSAKASAGPEGSRRRAMPGYMGGVRSVARPECTGARGAGAPAALDCGESWVSAHADAPARYRGETALHGTRESQVRQWGLGSTTSGWSVQ